MNLKPKIEVRFSDHFIAIEGIRVSRPPYITPSEWLRFWSLRFPAGKINASVLERPITDFQWSKRALAAFRFAEPPIKSLGDLTERTQLEVMLVPNCGQQTIAEIVLKLGELGLTLREGTRAYG